jgi:hypothetical protein
MRTNEHCVLVVVAAVVAVGCVVEDDASLDDLDDLEQDISGGTNDVNTPEANAIVSLPGCTGTLVTPDVVLTAGHCVGGRAQPPACVPSTTGDWETPGVWYPFVCGAPVPIGFGNDAAGLWPRATSVSTNERFVVNNVANTALQSGQSVTFRTANGHYVVAEGAVSYLAANRTHALEWETFRVDLLLDTGPINDGDVITLKAAGGMFVRRTPDGGLRADATSTASSSTWFRFRRTAGAGQVTDLDTIAIQDATDKYWTAVNGGGAPWVYQASATQYSLPVGKDILLLKLSAPVPASVAVPMDQVHRIPSVYFDASSKWNEYLCGVGQSCEVGDFNADGRDDAMVFARSTTGTLFVGRSSGTGFTAETWGSGFCMAGQECKVGDFNGDLRDDVVAITTSGVASVRLSTGTAFGGSTQWNPELCLNGETCKFGDVNGDGRDDAIVFWRSIYGGTAVGDVYVGLSNGTSFASLVKWHESFCTGNEVCDVGDFDGDDRTDLVRFRRSTVTGTAEGDVYVSLSNGTGFGIGTLWQGYFCLGQQVCSVGDFDGDGTDDIAAFYRDSSVGGLPNDVTVAISARTRFGARTFWASSFCPGLAECRSGDFDGDGRDDIASFARDSVSGAAAGDVRVARAWAPDEATFVAGERYKITGWGIDALSQGPALRQAGFVDFDELGFDWDMVNGVTVVPANGSISRPGDSGGPLMWWDPLKGKYVNLGALQSVVDLVNSRYTGTFRPAGPLGAWIRKSLRID